MTAASAPSEDTLLEASPSVLLVDDDEVNLMVTAMALRGRGFVVTQFSTGRAALGYLRTTIPDIVVLDALMPDLDGFVTCERLRALPALEHVPVLMLTGLDDDDSINRAYRAGATDFFVKTPQWSLLEGRLRYLLRASRTRQELLRSRARLARALDPTALCWQRTWPSNSLMDGAVSSIWRASLTVRALVSAATTPVSCRT
ncbi:MAG: response regulator [Rubrivivax sp.]|nr:response regulator [Rubrivivax sp.]